MSLKSISVHPLVQFEVSLTASRVNSITSNKNPRGSSRETVESSENDHECMKSRGQNPRRQLYLERKRDKGGKVKDIRVRRKGRRKEYVEETDESAESGTEDGERERENGNEGLDTEEVSEGKAGLEEVASRGKEVKNLQPTVKGAVESEEKAWAVAEQVNKRAEADKNVTTTNPVGSDTKNVKARGGVKAADNDNLTRSEQKKTAAAATEDHTPPRKDPARSAPSPAAKPANSPEGDDTLYSSKIDGEISSEEPKPWPAALTTATLTSPFSTSSWESVGRKAGRAPAAGSADTHSAPMTRARRDSREAPEAVESDTFTYHFNPIERSPTADLAGGSKNKESKQKFLQYPKISLKDRIAVLEGTQAPRFFYVGFKDNNIPQGRENFKGRDSYQLQTQPSYANSRREDTTSATASHEQSPPPLPPKIPLDVRNDSAYRRDSAGPSIQPRSGSAPPQSSLLSHPTTREPSKRRRSAYPEPPSPPGPSHRDPQLSNLRRTKSYERTRSTASRDLQEQADRFYSTSQGQSRRENDSDTDFSYLWDLSNHRYPEYPRMRSRSMERENATDEGEKYYWGRGEAGGRASDGVRYTADARRTSQTGYWDRNYPAQQPIRNHMPQRRPADRQGRGRSRSRDGDRRQRYGSRSLPERGEKVPAGRAYEEKRGRSARTAQLERAERRIFDEDNVEAEIDRRVAAGEKDAGFEGWMKEIQWILQEVADRKEQRTELTHKQKQNSVKVLGKIYRLMEDRSKKQR